MKHSDLPWYHKRIIGIAGPAGSGKDTVAKAIRDELGHEKTVRIAFADTLKEAVKLIYRFSDKQVYGDKKEDEDKYWDVTPRHVLQQMGTEVARTLDPDIWIKSFHLRLMEPGYGQDNRILTIIPDVRYSNEATWIRKHGVLWHIQGRVSHIENDHASEKFIEVSKRDLIFDNSDSLWSVPRHVASKLTESWEFIHAPT